MAWNVADNTLGLVISRQMTNTHQGGILVVLDGKDMSIVRNWGQVMSHEFGNSLHVAEDGTFLGVDIGDFAPRGIQLFDFSTTRGKQSKTVYKFKIDDRSQFGYNQVRSKQDRFARACALSHMH